MRGVRELPRKKTESITKAQIVRVATRRFLETGYIGTTVKAIADELGLSTGHVTFYYPTKEHLLAALVDMLCDFQWKLMERYGQEEDAELAAIALELTAMAAMCEENPIARDFYLNAYTLPMTLEIIRRNDTLRSGGVYGRYCPEWTDRMFAEAEVLVSGIEYATLMTTESSPALDVRIAGAVDEIFKIYNVPESIRNRLIAEVLRQDYRGMGNRIFQEFMDYIEQVNEQVLEDLLNRRQESKKG